MPGRGSSDWRTVNAGVRGAPAATWVVVADPGFYNEHDYILGDLKTRNDGPPLSVLSIAYTTKVKASRTAAARSHAGSPPAPVGRTLSKRQTERIVSSSD